MRTGRLGRVEIFSCDTMRINLTDTEKLILCALQHNVHYHLRRRHFVRNCEGGAERGRGVGVERGGGNDGNQKDRLLSMQMCEPV